MIAAQLRTLAETLDALKPDVAVRLQATLIAVLTLNQRGIFPAAMADHVSRPLAAEAQKFAQQFPYLIEDYPVYRVTELGRSLTRAGMEITDDEP